MPRRHSLVVPWDQRAAVMDAPVRQSHRSLPAIDALDRHTAMAGWTTLKSVPVEDPRLVEAKGEPSAFHYHFAGLGLRLHFATSRTMICALAQAARAFCAAASSANARAAPVASIASIFSDRITAAVAA